MSIQDVNRYNQDQALGTRGTSDGTRSPLEIVESQEKFKDHRAINPYVVIRDCRNVYTGGFSGSVNYDDDYSYMTPNPTENMYETKVRLSGFVNHPERYVRAQYESVFTKKPITHTVKVGDKAQEEHHFIDFMGDCDGMGTNINDFLENSIESCYWEEVVWLVMDKDNRLRNSPYLQRYEAHDVSDYQTDDFGRLSSISFVFWGEKDSKSVVRKYTFTTDMFISEYTSPVDVERYETLAQVVKRSETQLKWILEEESALEVNMPVKPFFAHNRSNPREYLPFPRVWSVIHFSWALWEIESNLDWTIHQQAHSWMIVIGVILEGMRDAKTNVVNITGDDGKSDVKMLSPDSSNVDVQIKRYEQKESTLSDVMAQDGVVVSKKEIEGQSGIAKMFTYQPLQKVSENTVSIVLDMMNWIVQTYQEYQGDSGWRVETETAKNFMPSADIAIDETLKILELFKNDSLTENYKSILEKIVKEYHPNAMSEDIAPLLEEVERLVLSI